jgi:hypothetical protein
MRHLASACSDRRVRRGVMAALAAGPAGRASPAGAASGPAATGFYSWRMIDAGHHFFGTVSQGLASVGEKAVGQWGLSNGYVLGEEAGGAFFGGLRYGEGILHTKNAGDSKCTGRGRRRGRPGIRSERAPTSPALPPGGALCCNCGRERRIESRPTGLFRRMPRRSPRNGDIQKNRPYRR